MTLKRALALTIAAALVLAPGLAGAQTKISNLPAGSAVAASDVMPMSQSCSGSPPTATCAATNGVQASALKTFAVSTIGAVTGALKSNGSSTFSQAGASDLSNGVTGSGAVVLATSPALVTPQLGVAKVTTFAGKNAISSITAGAAAQIGTGGTIVCAASYVCDSVSGALTITTGTGALTVGTLYTVNFADTRTNKPACQVSHFDTTTAGTSTNSYTQTETTTSLAVAGLLAASTTYTQRYLCAGN